MSNLILDDHLIWPTRILFFMIKTMKRKKEKLSVGDNCWLLEEVKSETNLPCLIGSFFFFG